MSGVVVLTFGGGDWALAPTRDAAIGGLAEDNQSVGLTSRSSNRVTSPCFVSSS